jgi:hypothetical protein
MPLSIPNYPQSSQLIPTEITYGASISNAIK